jgi:hypothetical protein
MSAPPCARRHGDEEAARDRGDIRRRTAVPWPEASGEVLLPDDATVLHVEAREDP